MIECFNELHLLCISTSFQVLSALEGWSNYFFSAVFNLVFSFETFFSDFLPKINKKCLKEEKKLKTAEKSSSTRFRVHPPPESWSKHTTYITFNFNGHTFLWQKFKEGFKHLRNQGHFPRLILLNESI